MGTSTVKETDIGKIAITPPGVMTCRGMISSI